MSGGDWGNFCFQQEDCSRFSNVSALRPLVLPSRKVSVELGNRLREKQIIGIVTQINY